MGEEKGNLINKVYDEFIQLVRAINNAGIRECGLELVYDFKDQLKFTTPSLSHHKFNGGTMVHSLNVAKIVDYAATIEDIENGIDHDVLIFGALFHDIGKLNLTRMEDGEAVTVDESLLKDHNIIGGKIVREYLTKYIEDNKLVDQIVNTIVGYVGLFEPDGSVSYKGTAEGAMIVYADSVSSYFELLIIDPLREKSVNLSKGVL